MVGRFSVMAEVGLGSVHFAAERGSACQKNRFLAKNSITTTAFNEIPLVAPFYLFVPQVSEGADEFSQFISIPDMFVQKGVGVVTARLDQPSTEFIGSRNPEVEKISWSRDTVWLDKKQTTGFRGVREPVWNFHIGGYQVCEKWLKDRKGRTLSADDIAHYQKIVVALAETIRLMQAIDEVIEQHGGWPGAFQSSEATAVPVQRIPFRPRIVEPQSAERYVTCVPLVPLKAAAGTFSDPQHIEDEGFEWVAVEAQQRLRKGMFVAQVVGKSMEPTIPDGAYCLFRAPVEGTRQGKTVLVQLRDSSDPETGQRYTVKRYESEKRSDGDLWSHERITLRPLNPDFAPIVLTSLEAGELEVIAEFVELLRDGSESALCT